MLLRRLLIATLAAAALAGCDHKPRSSANPARDRWDQVAPTMRTRIADLRSRQTVIAGRIGALVLPPGVDDPPLAAQFADLQGRVSALEPAIAELERETTLAAGDVDTALAAPDKIRARNAVDDASAKLDLVYNRVSAVFDELEPRILPAEESLKRHQRAGEIEEQRFMAASMGGGNLAMPDILFAPDTAQLDVGTPRSKASLDRLVRLAAACAEIRLTIGAQSTGADAATASRLARARAESVRTYLINSAVPGERVLLAPPPPPTTPPSTKDVISVDVAPCPRPSAAPAAGGPPPPVLERVN